MGVGVTEPQGHGALFLGEGQFRPRVMSLQPLVPP